jgi:antitoxin MazE
MKAHTSLVRWGNSLAVRLPKKIVKEARLREGQRLTVTAEHGAVAIARAEPELTLEALVAKITPRNRYGETVTGKAIGRERVEW